MSKRSTKAGTSAPATLGADVSHVDGVEPAQRRPGHQPRRHAYFASRAILRIIRSTKAGTSAPATLVPGATVYSALVAQRRPGHQPRRHSTAATCLATRSFAQRRPGHQPRRHVTRRNISRMNDQSLNEGRDISPGDTR